MITSVIIENKALPRNHQSTPTLNNTLMKDTLLQIDKNLKKAMSFPEPTTIRGDVC